MAPEGSLRDVATLPSGFTEEARTQLHALLACRVRPQPGVAGHGRSVWVDTGLSCRARFLEWTAGGGSRGRASAA